MVARGVRVNALVVHPESGSRQVCSGVIHREDLADFEPLSPPESPTQGARGSYKQPHEVLAYWPQRRLQDAIYGSVWACLVLKRHHGKAADDAAHAAGVEPGTPKAPIVWEITGSHVAIKMVEWARVHHMRGRLLEDPVKEVAAMQLIGTTHPHVLGSSEVLQDGDFLYSVMPYCSGGDLFGVVVEYAEESGGEGGMPEPVARYWFRQILQGLNHLQECGVCHRDLSLENILVDKENCLIIDMGMCLRVPYSDPKSRSRGTTDVAHGKIRRLMKPQGVCGKHNYMSPEIFENKENFDGFAIDLWATGVILYIMLTGFPPYDQASVTDQRFELIVTGKLVEQLHNWDIFVSDEAGDLMQRMLQMDPRDRPTLAQVMAHPWVARGEVQAPPVTEPLPYH
jgi:serine/threonine protein kinase